MSQTYANINGTVLLENTGATSSHYALEEALAYYKSSEFQPNIKLAFQYKGQAAIDTGRVLCQFYSDVFCQMMEGGGDLPPLFEGASRRKLPVHNAGTVLSSVLELVRKIFAHSVVQVGVGPACLSPGVFKYFVIGDLTETITCLSVEVATNPTLKAYMEKVCFGIKIVVYCHIIGSKKMYLASNFLS